MLQRIEPEGEKTMEAAVQEFNNSLGVSAWPTPGTPVQAAPEVGEGAPLWWHGEEDASQSFLMSQGVILGG